MRFSAHSAGLRQSVPPDRGVEFSLDAPFHAAAMAPDGGFSVRTGLGLVMQVAGMDTSKYDAVMEKVGLSSANPN